MKINRPWTVCLVAQLCANFVCQADASDQGKRTLTKPFENVGPAETAETKTNPDGSSTRSSPIKSTDFGVVDSDYPPTIFNKTTALLQMRIQNQQGEKLGELQDIVIDLDNGKVSYVVIKTGGILGIGHKLVALPITALARSADQTHLVLHADQAIFRDVKSMGDDWPLVKNPHFEAESLWRKPEKN